MNLDYIELHNDKAGDLIVRKRKNNFFIVHVSPNGDIRQIKTKFRVIVYAELQLFETRSM